MSEMIERVERAIKDTFGTDWPEGRFGPGEIARAAIAAMREPTPEMVGAGMREASTTLADEWRAMIDESLR